MPGLYVAAGTFSSAITGTGSLTKQGGGNLILSGTSTYTGVTSAAAGAAVLLAAIGMGLAAHRAIRRRRLLY